MKEAEFFCLYLLIGFVYASYVLVREREMASYYPRWLLAINFCLCIVFWLYALCSYIINGVKIRK